MLMVVIDRRDEHAENGQRDHENGREPGGRHGENREMHNQSEQDESNGPSIGAVAQDCAFHGVLSPGALTRSISRCRHSLVLAENGRHRSSIAVASAP